MQLYTAPFGDFLFKGSAQTAMWADPVYNRLIEFNPETPDSSDIRGDLAAEWSISADGLTYTFKLHPNVTFHDGTPLTAEDVVFSWGLFVDCESVAAVKDKGICPFTSGQHKLFSTYYDSARAVDDHTVELKTQFTAPAFTTNLSQGELIVLPKHLIEAGTFPSELDFKNLIGSGPFKMSSHTRDVGTQYEKNTDYFKEGYPRWDGMDYFVMKDKGTIIAAYKTEQVLLSAGTQNNLSFTDGLQLAKEMGGKALLFTSGPKAGMGLLVNAKVELFDNDEVRRAFMLIIHRQPVIETLSDGFYPIGFPIAPDVYWFSRSTDDVVKLPGFRELNGEKHPDDIAEAKRLFANHGMGPGFKVAITCRTILEYCEMATLLADQFRRFLGWDPSVDAGDPVVNIGRFNDGDYELGIMANSCGFPDPDSCLTSAYALPTSGMRRRAHYTSDEIVDLSELQTREIDQEKRGALVRQAEELLLNGKNAFPYTHFLMSPVIVNNRIQNYHVPPAYSFQEKNEHLWCDPAC
jgi:peptide/nickel transport system substrate-binding protein